MKSVTPGKIGFLGGTFNPIHNGHISAALNAIEKLRLDRVVILPGSNPPHKTDEKLLPFDVRYRLIEESIREYPMLEGQRPGQHAGREELHLASGAQAAQTLPPRKILFHHRCGYYPVAEDMVSLPGASGRDHLRGGHTQYRRRPRRETRLLRQADHAPHAAD